MCNVCQEVGAVVLQHFHCVLEALWLSPGTCLACALLGRQNINSWPAGGMTMLSLSSRRSSDQMRHEGPQRSS